MAGAAGFEPAAPGLGGQCIIQAMLHARPPQSLPLKKSSEEKRPFGPPIVRCHEAPWAARSHMEGPLSPLPTPYGEESGFGAKNERALSRMIARRDAGRRFWTWLSSIRTTSEIRLTLPAIATVSCAVLLVGWEHSSIEVSIGLFTVISILYVPTNMASWFSSMVARDRLSLTVEGHKSKGSYPGSERIISTLRDRVIRERLRLISAILGAASLYVVLRLNPGTVLAPSLMASGAFFGTVCILNSLRLEGSMPMRSNDFTLLSLHAPTLHDSILKSVLTDSLKAHLDPETSDLWDEWMDSLEFSVRTGQTPRTAVEHVLQSIHWEQRGIIDRNRLISEVKTVFKIAATDSLFDSSNKFNASSLSKLLAHTRAWEPGLFRLLDRLHDSVAGPQGEDFEKWRLDLDLPPRCSEGQGELFVMLHNHTGEAKTVELDIIVAKGEPAFQSLRLSAPTTPHPSMSSGDQVDKISKLVTMLERAVVLWIGIAWPDSESGPHPVQVTLKGESGETLSSMVVQTSLTTGVNPESAAVRMTEASEAVRRIAIPLSERQI